MRHIISIISVKLWSRGVGDLL